MRKLWTSLVVLGVSAAAPAFAADATWPAFDVLAGPEAGAKTIAYAPQPVASKKWKLCVLVPHLKDSYWVAADYGLVTEAKRLGVQLNLYQAGGYDQLPKQVAQFDDCMAAKADAVIVAPISEAGLTAKVQEASKRGVPTVGLINPISASLVTTAVTNDQFGMGHTAGMFFKDAPEGKNAKVVAFPGPQGSGWAEKYLEGFKAAVQGSGVTVLGEKFGDPGVAVQLKLVEDALQSYPSMNAIWGTGPTAEAAVGAVAEAGNGKVMIVSSYADQSSIDLLKKNKIAGFVSDCTVMQARIAVDQAVAVLEKRPYERVLVVPPRMISKANAASTDYTMLLAPANWQPAFSVN